MEADKSLDLRFALVDEDEKLEILALEKIPCYQLPVLGAVHDKAPKRLKKRIDEGAELFPHLKGAFIQELSLTAHVSLRYGRC